MTHFLTLLYSTSPAHRGRLRRRARVRSGMRRPAGWLVTTPPGGVRATPPSRHYERDAANAANARPEDTAAQCNVRRHRPARDSEPINRRGGAPRGERPPAARTAKAVCAGTRGATLRACGPTSLARRTGAAAPERLSALRSLTLSEGKSQTSEEHMPRENEGVRFGEK